MADIFGYVPAYLRDVFRSKYEKSPMEYLQELRVRMCKENVGTGTKITGEGNCQGGRI